MTVHHKKLKGVSLDKWKFKVLSKTYQVDVIFCQERTKAIVMMKTVDIRKLIITSYTHNTSYTNAHSWAGYAIIQNIDTM